MHGKEKKRLELAWAVWLHAKVVNNRRWNRKLRGRRPCARVMQGWPGAGGVLPVANNMCGG